MKSLDLYICREKRFLSWIMQPLIPMNQNYRVKTLEQFYFKVNLEAVIYWIAEERQEIEPKHWTNRAESHFLH